MRASKASAAASQDLAISMARSALTFQGCDRSRFGGARAMSAASASPALSSSAVKRAMLQALATVARTASMEKSAVLAVPLRCPKYTVTPMLRSRWCSRVSTSPKRTPTDRPVSWLTAASAWEAPRARASSSARSIMDSRSVWVSRTGVWVTAIVSPTWGCRESNGDSTGPSDSMGNMSSENDAQDSGESEEQRLSKSARKREAASLQELGVKLSALPDQEIKALDLPENLFVALRDLRRLPSHGAQVRQRQYIGKLMRDIDPEPVLAKLAERKQRHDLEIRHFQQIERWRDRLLSEPAAALSELLEEYPNADRAALTRLLDKAEKERAEQRSPVGARELFAFLRQLLGINW